MSKNDILGDDDFEQLLDSFINAKIDDEEKNEIEISSDEKKAKAEEIRNNIDDDNDDWNEDDVMLVLNPADQQINSDLTAELEEDMSQSLSEAINDVKQKEDMPSLGNDEAELAQAFVNFYTSVNRLSIANLNQEFKCSFQIDDLYPNYKPSIGAILSEDLIKGWLTLVKIFPDEIGNFPPSSTDEEFLNFAEKLNNSDLQLAVISYIEILIDIESCELSYQAKLIKYQERHIKRIMYEEYLARKERQRKFTEALKKKNFPVDAERLISNYFRVAQKDVEGAFSALTSNPAIFSPIDFSKIKPRLFGLIKVSPKDGIRINTEIGNFLKKLKV